MGFFIFTETFFMDEIRTIGKKWMVNELGLSFWALKRSKFQSNPIILSKVIVFTDDNDTKTDRNFRKNLFF